MTKLLLILTLLFGTGSVFTAEHECIPNKSVYEELSRIEASSKWDKHVILETMEDSSYIATIQLHNMSKPKPDEVNWLYITTYVDANANAFLMTIEYITAQSTTIYTREMLSFDPNTGVGHWNDECLIKTITPNEKR
jgi:hypothetical protein